MQGSAVIKQVIHTFTGSTQLLNLTVNLKERERFPLPTLPKNSFFRVRSKQMRVSEPSLQCVGQIFEADRTKVIRQKLINTSVCGVASENNQYTPTMAIKAKPSINSTFRRILLNRNQYSGNDLNAQYRFSTHQSLNHKTVGQHTQYHTIDYPINNRDKMFHPKRGLKNHSLPRSQLIQLLVSKSEIATKKHKECENVNFQASRDQTHCRYLQSLNQKCSHSNFKMQRVRNKLVSNQLTNQKQTLKSLNVLAKYGPWLEEDNPEEPEQDIM